MLKHLLNTFRSELEVKIQRIEEGMTRIVRKTASKKSWVAHYGGSDEDPSRLVFWVCVQTDAEKERLAADTALRRKLREQLAQHDYPPDARSGVHIGFESQETVDRVSKGNWWGHWK